MKEKKILFSFHNNYVLLIEYTLQFSLNIVLFSSIPVIVLYSGIYKEVFWGYDTSLEPCYIILLYKFKVGIFICFI